MNKSTKDISNELIQREGVSSIKVDPYEKVTIKTDQGKQEFTGPAIIVINQD